MRSNENKMSDGGRGRVSLGVKVWKSSQKWNVQRSASLLANAFGVRSIAWLGLLGGLVKTFLLYLQKLLCVEQRDNLAVASNPQAISLLVGG
jgi:hypothetical protein